MLGKPLVTMQRMVKQQMGNMQIQQKVAQSKTLRNLTDGQVREFSEEKFQTNKEFMSFMGNPNTEVLRLGSGSAGRLIRKKWPIDRVVMSQLLYFKCSNKQPNTSRF